MAENKDVKRVHRAKWRRKKEKDGEQKKYYNGVGGV